MFLTDALTGCVDASLVGTTEAFLRDALHGLSQTPKTLPCKYFYDERGSRLFDEICDLEEYYPTRTELAIMDDSAADMANAFQPGDILVELGSGSSVKTRLLLDRLPFLSAYVPVDISADYLAATADGLRMRYPHLDIRPVAADYTRPFAVPVGPGRRIMAYFPGSTIGNFHPSEAAAFLRQIRSLTQNGGGLLIGVDLRKDHDILRNAYNDSRDVTARFNLNLLERMNNELGADFNLDCFAHSAPYNPIDGRIEMHLISLRPQTVRLGDTFIHFDENETIWTESSYKHTLATFESLAGKAGFKVAKVWTDANRWFSVQLLS